MAYLSIYTKSLTSGQAGQTEYLLSHYRDTCSRVQKYHDVITVDIRVRGWGMEHKGDCDGMCMFEKDDSKITKKSASLDYYSKILLLPQNSFHGVLCWSKTPNHCTGSSRFLSSRCPNLSSGKSSAAKIFISFFIIFKTLYITQCALSYLSDNFAL